MPRECITHFHACDCREAEFAKVKAKLDVLQARIADAPQGIMDTRVALGICAPTEEDFPALYALQGKTVYLVVAE
jgi:hypothetical protein